MGIFIDDLHAHFFVLIFAYKAAVIRPGFDLYSFGSMVLFDLGLF